MKRLNHEREVIKKVINFYNKQCGFNFGLDYYPEDDKKTPPEKRIDAVYKNSDLKIAIEHTSLDSYINQRKQEVDIRRALEPLKESLENKLYNEGYYSLALSANCIVPTKIDWGEFRENIYNKILEKYKCLVLPKLNRISTLKVNIDSPHFEFMLCRHSSKGKLNGKFIISRFAYDSDDLDNQKKIILAKALRDKSKKLLTYTSPNCLTLLILELIDFDWEEFHRAFSNIKGEYSKIDLPTKIIAINTTFSPWWCSYLKMDEYFLSWDEFIKYEEINV